MSPTPRKRVEPGDAAAGVQVIDRTIDLDAARAARREKQGPQPTVMLLGQTYPLPRSMPAKVLDMIGAVATGDFTLAVTAMKTMLGGETFDTLSEAAEAAGDPLELEDVTYLLERVLEVYGVTAGK